MDLVEKIYPKEEELSQIKHNHECSECKAIFKNETNLNLHLAKTHKRAQLLTSGNKNRIYFCPIKTCAYNLKKHFKQFKLLKQHFLKVHSERKFACNMCKKGFPTEATCHRHSEFCSVVFTCCDCENSYACYDTLKTHGRRKNHKILEKNAYKHLTKKIEDAGKTLNKMGEKSEINQKLRHILPNIVSSTSRAVIADTVERGCQTEASNQKSQETQTFSLIKMPQFNMETQTIGDYFTKKSDSLDNLKSAKTQTPSTDPKTASCNTSFNLDDFELNMLPEVQRSSSSTQTNLYTEPEQIFSSTSTHDSIHTDTSDLLTDSFDSNFFNCNMETQTDFIFNDELFKYCDDYTNMYTQTCEDLLLAGIGFNSSHTQTVFDDVLKSVESQTVMSQFPVMPLHCKDNASNMETQTDAHYQQMLEEINA